MSEGVTLVGEPGGSETDANDVTYHHISYFLFFNSPKGTIFESTSQ